MVMEGEEMLASRLYSSSSTLDRGLEGKLIDLRWQAISVAETRFSVLMLRR